MIDNPPESPITPNTETAAVATTRAKTFHWIQGASLEALYQQLGSVDRSAAWLEVHILPDDRMYFHVMQPGAASTRLSTDESGDMLPAIDDSFVCPPVCPG